MKEGRKLAAFLLAIEKISETSFHQIVSDKKLKKMWLHWIGRANFVPGKHQSLTQAKPRTTYKCRNRVTTVKDGEMKNEVPFSCKR